MLLPGAEILNSIVRKTPRAEFLEKQFLHLEYNDSVGGGGGFPRTSLPPTRSAIQLWGDTTQGHERVRPSENEAKEDSGKCPQRHTFPASWR